MIPPWNPKAILNMHTRACTPRSNKRAPESIVYVKIFRVPGFQRQGGLQEGEEGREEDERRTV